MSSSESSGGAKGRRRPDLAALTSREREILELVAEGLRSRDIGERLGIAEATVKRHLNNTYRKLGARNRVDAVAMLLSAGRRGRAR